MTTPALTPRIHLRRNSVRLLVIMVFLGCLIGYGPGATRAHASTAAAKTPLRVAVIGDSIAYGQSDCGDCATFVDLYARSLGRRLGREVTASNLSTHDGLTAPRLVERIRTDDFYRSGVAAADILIVSIGHNDTPWGAQDDTCDGANEAENWDLYIGPCLKESAAQTGAQLTAFLAEAKRLRAGKPTVQIVTNVYNDWLGYSEADVPPEAVAGSIRVIPVYDKALCLAARRSGAVCVDIWHAFNGPDGTAPAGDLIGPDTVHPTAKGHQVIARLLNAVDISAVIKGCHR